MYRSIKSPTQGQLARNRLKKNLSLQMPSPVTLYKGQLRVKICEKPKYWDDYATISSATGEGSRSPQHHDGMAMPALGEGRGTLTHAVYFPTLQAPGSLFSILTIIFACIQLHQPKLVVTSWTIVFRDKLYLASPLKKKKKNLCLQPPLFPSSWVFAPPPLLFHFRNTPQFHFLASLRDSTNH